MKMAVVDAVMMVHTKPPAKGIAAKKSGADGRKGGESFYDKQKIDPEQELKETLAKYAHKLWSYGVRKMEFEGKTLRVIRS